MTQSSATKFLADAHSHWDTLTSLPTLVKGSFTSVKSFEGLVPDNKKANEVSCFVAEVQKYIDTALLL